ncbi:MAG: hypothetical protein V4857_07080 [Pseudomonadota bacterium]
MSDLFTPPGGLSLKRFNHLTAEISLWIWGTAQGAFNEKQTLSQIITDAVIGMIPVVGDITAARDLIAVSVGLAMHPEKREHKMEWVLLVILFFALIPVIGGVIKGVGRIALRVTADVTEDSVQIAKVGRDVIAFLNRMGHKNAEAWLRALDVMKYQPEILKKFHDYCETIILAIAAFLERYSSLIPQSMIDRLKQLSEGVKNIKIRGNKMIPEALKDLYAKLDHIKKTIHAGGVPPPTIRASLVAQTGQKALSYVEEARLLRSNSKKAAVRAGKYAQNIAAVGRPGDIAKVYKYEAGFPNLFARTIDDPITGIKYYPYIAAASGPIKNEMIHGETLFRAFGAEGVTHGVTVGKSNPIGPFWGRSAPPKTSKEFRGPSAVLDEWNRTGWLSVMHVPPHVKLPACTSTVSEQFSKEIPGQFLPGGGQQVLTEKFFDDQVIKTTERLYAQGGGKATLSNGVVVEVRPSGWTDANGILGYGETVIPKAGVIERLGLAEIETKGARQVVQAGAKDHRNKEAARKQ